MLPRIALLMVALLALPLATADWRAAGGLEPDTQRDRDDALMFASGDAGTDATIKQVHFQAFVAAPQTSLNPNVGLVGSRVLPAPALHHRALLGVWKDCNSDGYVGLAESAVMDYSAGLLLSTSVCPPTRGSSSPVHNDGMWVSELLSIGMVDPCEHEPDASIRASCGVDAFAPNERVLYAPGTFVWGDLGAPGDVPPAECILAPLPSGTTSGTGALIGWADCQSRRGVARTVNDVDTTGALGLRFENESQPENSSSHLNQRFPVTPFGAGGKPGLLQDDTDQAAASAWDCEAPAAVRVDDPQGYREVALTDPTNQLHAERFPLVIVYALTGLGFVDEDHDPATPGVFRRALTDKEGNYAKLPAPGPRLHDPTASWWVALERLADGPAGDCDPETASPLAAAYVGGMVESDARPILEARKDRTSFTFTFYDGHRGYHPSLDPHTGATMPSDGGTLWLDHGRGGDGPMWSATVQSEQDPQLVNREDLGFTPGVYFTYYAALGDAALGFTLPSGGPRTYGSDNCGVHESGVHRGWVCDASLWWKDADGDDNTPRYAQGLRIGRLPGDPYHLRDVDCYDGELARGSGLYASFAAFLADGTCR